MDPNNRAAIEAMLSDADDFAALAAFSALGNAGANASDALPRLKELLAETGGGLLVRKVGRSRIQLRPAQIKERIDQIETAISNSEKGGSS